MSKLYKTISKYIDIPSTLTIIIFTIAVILITINIHMSTYKYKPKELREYLMYLYILQDNETIHICTNFNSKGNCTNYIDIKTEKQLKSYINFKYETDIDKTIYLFTR